MQRSSKSEFRFVRSQDNYFFHFPGYFKLYYRHRQPRHLTNSASAVLFISPRFVLHLRFCTLREYSWGPEAVTFSFSFFFFFFFSFLVGRDFAGFYEQIKLPQLVRPSLPFVDRCCHARARSRWTTR